MEELYEQGVIRAIGTANFFNPTATVNVIEGIEKFMLEHGINDLSEIRGIID